MPGEQYERLWRDYYEILQVHPRAESEVISAAYRKLAFMYHPDRNRNSDAVERLKVINEAHEVLCDPGRRALYDQAYHAKQQAGNTSANNGSSGPSAEGGRWQERQEEPDPDPWEEADYSSGGSAEATRQKNFGTDASDSWERIRVWLAPKPGDPAGILPWPSWHTQRALLIGTVPVGLLILVAAAASIAIPVASFAALMTGAAVYAGVKTRWLQQAQEAPTPAKIAGGTTIAVSGVTVVLTTISVVLAIVATILLLFVMCAVGRAMAEQSSKSK